MSWLARTAGDLVRNTSLTYDDIADMTDEQILVVVASAAREFRDMEGNSSTKTHRPLRKEGFKSEDELKANYMQLGRLLGMSPEQSELEWQACKERGAKFEPKKGG